MLSASSLRKLGYQGHHIIPREITKKDLSSIPDPVLRESFKNAKDLISGSGFNIETIQNMIFLPDGREGTFGHESRPVHRGPHPEYTKNIAVSLSEVYLESIDQEWSSQKQLEAVYEVIAKTRQDLREGNLTLNNAVDYSRAADMQDRVTLGMLSIEQMNSDDSDHSEKSRHSLQEEPSSPVAIQTGFDQEEPASPVATQTGPDQEEPAAPVATQTGPDQEDASAPVATQTGPDQEEPAAPVATQTGPDQEDASAPVAIQTGLDQETRLLNDAIEYMFQNLPQNQTEEQVVLSSKILIESLKVNLAPGNKISKLDTPNITEGNKPGGVIHKSKHLEGVNFKPGQHMIHFQLQKDTEMPISTEDIQRLLQEVVQLVYVDKTLPWFSLDRLPDHFSFGSSSTKNTLIYKAMKETDIFMKATYHHALLLPESERDEILQLRHENKLPQSMDDWRAYFLAHHAIDLSKLKSASKLQDLELIHYMANLKLSSIIYSKDHGLCLSAELKRAILVSNSLYLNSTLSIINYEVNGDAEILEENDKSLYLSTLKYTMYDNPKINHYLQILEIVSGLIAICQALKNENLLPKISSFASPIEEKELVPPLFYQPVKGTIEKSLSKKHDGKEEGSSEGQIFGGNRFKAEPISVELKEAKPKDIEGFKWQPFPLEIINYKTDSFVYKARKMKQKLDKNHDLKQFMFLRNFTKNSLMSLFYQAVLGKNIEACQKLLEQNPGLLEKVEFRHVLQIIEICKIDIVKFLFDLGLDPNILSHKKDSLLMVVSQKENFDVLRYLLNHPKININYIAPTGNNIIFASLCFPESMRLVLKHKEKIQILERAFVPRKEPKQQGTGPLSKKAKPMIMQILEGALGQSEEEEQQGTDPSLEQWKPIMVATGLKQTEAVRMLIKAGVSVNQMVETDDKRKIPLISVSLDQGDDDTALAIMKAPDFDFSSKDSMGRTVFMNVCATGRMAVFWKLWKNVSSTDLAIRDIDRNSALDLAVIGNHSEISRRLIPKYKRIIDRPNKEGKTLLHHAIQNDNLDIVQSLLEVSANPYLVSKKYPVSAIDFAIEKSNPAIIDALLTQEKSLNPKALEYAIKLKNPDLIKKLLDKGYDPNTPIDTEGHTGIMKAILLNNKNAIDIFLGTKLTLSQKNKDNETLVSLACRRKLTSLALYFIEKGCPLDTTVTGTSRFKGMTAIHIAAMHGMKEVVLKILNLHPGFLNQKNKSDENKTPLHYAVNYKNTEMVETLLGLGCDTSDIVLTTSKSAEVDLMSKILFQHMYKVSASEFEKAREATRFKRINIEDFLESIWRNKEKTEPIRQLVKSHLGISIKDAIKTHGTTILAMKKLLNYSRFEAAYVLNRYIESKVLVHIRKSDREKTFLEKKKKLYSQINYSRVYSRVEAAYILNRFFQSKVLVHIRKADREKTSIENKKKMYSQRKVLSEKKEVLLEIINFVLTNRRMWFLCDSSISSYYGERAYKAIQSFLRPSPLLLKK